MRTILCSGRQGVCVCVQGVSRSRGCVQVRGMCPGGVHLSPPVDRMTDTCENITFPQLLLRTVMKAYSVHVSGGSFQIN